MLNKRSLRQFMPIILAAFAFLASCKDETGTLGLDVLPSDDLFSGTDTESYFPAQNENPVRLRSDDKRFAKIGTVTDPYAGTTEASFITEVTLGDLAVGELNKSNDSVIYTVDSLVLNLSFREDWCFGDTAARHNFQVYQLNSSLDFNQRYYSDMPIEGLYNETPLGQKVANIRDTTQIINGTDTISQFQITLSQELAEEIFNFQEDTMTNRDEFKKVFNPLFIKSDLVDQESNGSLIALDLLASTSNLTLFYSFEEIPEEGDEEDPVVVNTFYTFPINRECVRINRYTHDNAANIELGTPDADHLIAQGMAGSLIKIDFNDVDFTDEEGQTHNLFDYWESKIGMGNQEDQYYGISAVDVAFKADTSLHYENERFISPVPLKLSIFEMTENGDLEVPTYSYTPNDDSEWAPEFSGGILNPETAEYQFRLAGETFKMMVEKPELRGPYYLSLAKAETYDFGTRFPWRAILANESEDANTTPRFAIKFVKIQN